MRKIEKSCISLFKDSKRSHNHIDVLVPSLISLSPIDPQQQS